MTCSTCTDLQRRLYIALSDADEAKRKLAEAEKKNEELILKLGKALDKSPKNLWEH